MAKIDRKSLYKSLDDERPEVEGDEGSEGDFAPEEQLLAAIEAKDPEAIHEALRACYDAMK